MGCGELRILRGINVCDQVLGFVFLTHKFMWGFIVKWGFREAQMIPQQHFLLGTLVIHPLASHSGSLKSQSLSKCRSWALSAVGGRSTWPKRYSDLGEESSEMSLPWAYACCGAFLNMLLWKHTSPISGLELMLEGCFPWGGGGNELLHLRWSSGSLTKLLGVGSLLDL